LKKEVERDGDGRSIKGWMTVARAAAVLDMTPSALRRRLERAATRTESGSTEARSDGILARKLGRCWRIALGPEWTEGPDDLHSSGSRGARAAKKGAP
jgi:hypothetical protein